jgi:hypothetical protein
MQLVAALEGQKVMVCLVVMVVALVTKPRIMEGGLLALVLDSVVIIH